MTEFLTLDDAVTIWHAGEVQSEPQYVMGMLRDGDTKYVPMAAERNNHSVWLRPMGAKEVRTVVLSRVQLLELVEWLDGEKE